MRETLMQFVGLLREGSTTAWVFFVCILLAGYLLFRLTDDDRRQKKEREQEEEEARRKEEERLKVLRDYTPTQLARCNGRPPAEEEGAPAVPNPAAVPPPKTLLAVKGEVFDVSEAPHYYGPQGAYHMFAGRDVTNALAKFSFEEDALKDTHEGRTDCYTVAELDVLEEFIAKYKYQNGYPIVGRLVYPPRPEDRPVLSLTELRRYDGTQPVPEGRVHAPILIALRGNVYDVSFGGTHFYTGESMYRVFAGRDASRAFALMSVDPADLEDGKGTQLDDLTPEQIKVLDNWEKKFRDGQQYPIVAYLEGSEAARNAASTSAATATSTAGES